MLLCKLFSQNNTEDQTENRKYRRIQSGTSSHENSYLKISQNLLHGPRKENPFSSPLVSYGTSFFSQESLYAIERIDQLCKALSMCSICVNPVLYGFLNTNFRREFSEIAAIVCFRCTPKNRRFPPDLSSVAHTMRLDELSHGRSSVQSVDGRTITLLGHTNFRYLFQTREPLFCNLYFMR